MKLLPYLFYIIMSTLHKKLIACFSRLESYLLIHGTVFHYQLANVLLWLVDTIFRKTLWLYRNIVHAKHVYYFYGFYLSVYLDLDEMKYPPSKHFIQSIEVDRTGREFCLFVITPTDIPDFRKNYYFYHFLRVLNANLFIHDTYLLFVVKLESKDFSHKLLSTRRFYTANALRRMDFILFSKRLLAFLEDCQKTHRILEVRIHFYNSYLEPVPKKLSKLQRYLIYFIMLYFFFDPIYSVLYPIAYLIGYSIYHLYQFYYEISSIIFS